MVNKVTLRKEQLDRIQDYVVTFSSDAGKRVLEDLEKSFGGECYVKGDLYETLYRSYNRDLIIRIKSMLKMAEMPFEIEEEKEEEN